MQVCMKLERMPLKCNIQETICIVCRPLDQFSNWTKSCLTKIHIAENKAVSYMISTGGLTSMPSYTFIFKPADRNIVHRTQ